jgi:protocatechuate 3,4-dioxygenase beta subunit/Zn-dependent protease with chaperone function
MMHALVEFANAASDRWAAWIVATSLDAALLLALISLLWLTLRKRVAPQVGCWLFLLVPLKLLMPLEIPVPAALACWTPSELLKASWGRAENFPLAHRENQMAEETSNDGSAMASAEMAVRSHQQVDGSRTGAVQPLAGSPARSAATAVVAPVQSISVRQTARLSVSAAGMLVWLGAVLLLVARLVWVQLRLRRRLQEASPIDPTRFPVDLHELCRWGGVRQRVHFVESDDIGAPAVWGVFRPTIVLPRGIAATLATTELTWAILHELAHIRRRDLFVIWLQRAAAILHFFNPAVWIANGLLSRLREFACDDFAESAAGVSGVQAGEAFLKVLRHANRRQREYGLALGVLGFDPLASCTHRVRRMLDPESRTCAQPGSWSICAIVLLAALVLPNLRAADEPQAPANQPLAKSASALTAPGEQGNDLAAAQKTFEFIIVGPDAKPIPDVNVDVRSQPIVTAEQIQQGKFLKAGTYGPQVKADAAGRLVIKLPVEPERFSLGITTAGYGPYWAVWNSHNNSQPIPSTFTAELESAWSVGGIVVDENERPVEGAKVHPSIRFKMRPGDLEELHIGDRLTTDAQGKWRFDSVPVSMSEVGVEIAHPEFMPRRSGLPRSQFGINQGAQPIEKIELERGLVVSGKVTDEHGQPIAGALVRTKFTNDIHKATTDDAGIYKIVGCEPRMAKIVVSAKGRATDMQEVRIGEGLKPVDFKLPPGGKVRIRVLDEKGNPVPKARILFQQWRGRFEYFEFNHMNQYADASGVWQWDEAPVDSFHADICRPDGMQLGRQFLMARDAEYVFRLPPALVISGKVVDAQTREPIKSFRVVPGVRSSESHMNWVPGQTFTGADGQFVVRHTHDSFAHLVRVEASGYLAAESRDIRSNEGNVAIEFALKKGQDIAATVLTPQGQPAAKAKIALGMAGSQISVKNGNFDGQTYATRDSTDDSGRFSFPPVGSAYQLVILHPTGYAHLKSAGEPASETIQLIAWARVEGTFRIGKRPVAGVPISIGVETLHSYGKDVPKIFTHHDVTTGADGRFVFERVIPGNGHIGRRIMLTVEDGAVDATSSIRHAAILTPGETAHIDLGGHGVPVIGKLQPPAGFVGAPLWNFALLTARVDLPEPFRSISPYITASVDRDGRFRIDDMPAGEYLLTVRFDRDPVGRLSQYRFTVPPADRDRLDKPLDLGLLTLERL